jgi:hypothetical protein
MRRLEGIISLIESCRYSIHDMSRVELDSTPLPTPASQYAFEPGLSVLDSDREPTAHTWFFVRVCELAYPIIPAGFG